MTSYCTQCGLRVPDGQRTCSMCYGDVDHGRDGYYRDWLEQEDETQRQQEQPHEEGEEKRIGK